MNRRRLRALLRKESYQILRDPSALMIAVVLPLILLMLMGYAISLDSQKIKLGVLNHDSGPHGRELIERFAASPYFELHHGGNKKELERMMQTGEIRAILTLPSNFSKALFEKRPTLQVVADGTEPVLAGFVQRYAGGLFSGWLAEQPQMQTKRPQYRIDVDERYWFNAPLKSSYFLLPGSIAIVMTMIGTLLTALVVAREWERGTMEAMMATPVTPLEMILGKLLPYFVLGMASMVLCFSVSVFWFEVPFLGSLWMLLLLGVCYLFPSLTLGLLISTLAKNQFIAAQASLIAGFLPAFLLSGFLFEIESMPTWLQYFTHVIPARYFVESLQTIFIAGDVPAIFYKDMAAMLLIGTILGGIVYKKTAKRLA